MKRIYITPLMLWLVACLASPSPLTLQNSTATPEIWQAGPSPSTSMTPALTLTPFFTPSPSAPALQLQPTLIIPTIQSGSVTKLLSLQMIDAKVGWGVQEEAREILRPGSRTEYMWPPEGYILRTSDGGKTWQNVTPPSSAYSPGGFFALDANTAWASGNSTGSVNGEAILFWHTSDGGKTWEASQPLYIADWYEIYFPGRMQFVDENTGWILAGIEVGMSDSLREALFHTSDGGNTWERINSFLEDLGGCGNGGLAFSDTRIGWYGSNCVGGGKLIIPFNTIFAQGGLEVRHTIDGGKTFSADTIIPTPPELQELATANPEMMDCGENRIVTFTPEVLGIEWECINYTDWMKYKYFSLSTDAGQTWKTREPAGNEYFFNAQRGWRLLSRGQLQQTIDGGSNWVNIKTVGWESAQFDFISEQEGWAIVTSADSVAIVHTTDGGKSWEEIKPTIVP